uniref:4'-phosphopantetheinyl transferase domain-containing protein n=2 Tax=Phytophthora ramorum TaxID=164328 RepID=H3GWT4_PHYRM
MLPPPSLTVVQLLSAEEVVADVVPCTCGAKDFILKRKQMKSLAKEGTLEAKHAANGADTPTLHRSLWRKLLGKGPKCICQKRRSSKSGLIEIPAEYVGCSVVTVAGKRVPFSRDMQQQCRKSWTPLDAIKEDDDWEMARVFGIGVDVALVSRLERSFARFGERLLRRAFHPAEIAEFHARPSGERATFLASRWAVKEATFKAFQRYRVLFPEIHAVRRGLEGPAVPTALPVTEHSKALRLQFSGETEALAKRLRLVEAHVSISHDGDYAVAYVLLQQEVDDEG